MDSVSRFVTYFRVSVVLLLLLLVVFWRVRADQEGRIIGYHYYLLVKEHRFTLKVEHDRNLRLSGCRGHHLYRCQP